MAAKPKRGRPPIREEDRRETILRVRLTWDEEARLKLAASGARMTLSAYIRDRCLPSPDSGRARPSRASRR